MHVEVRAAQGRALTTIQPASTTTTTYTDQTFWTSIVTAALIGGGKTKKQKVTTNYKYLLPPPPCLFPNRVCFRLCFLLSLPRLHRLLRLSPLLLVQGMDCDFVSVTRSSYDTIWAWLLTNVQAGKNVTTIIDVAPDDTDYYVITTIDKYCRQTYDVCNQQTLDTSTEDGRRS